MYFDELSAYDKIIVGNKVHPKTIDKILKKVLSIFGLKFSKKRDKNATTNHPLLNGWYKNSVGEDELDLTVQVLHHPQTTYYTMDQQTWDYFKERIVDVIEHEYRHHEQNVARNGEKPAKQRFLINQRHKSGIRSLQQVAQKKKGDVYSSKDWLEDIAYLTNKDEMDAFASNVASELLDTFGSKELALKRLKNFAKLKLKHSPSLDQYNIMFVPKSKIMKKFIKMVTNYINGFER